MTRRLILLADDDESIRDLLGTTLPGEWFEVVEARDGEQALAIAEERRLDLVVLDWRMPEKSGDEVLAAVKAADPMTCVIVLTAEDLPDERETARRLGADEFLTKPFSQLQLLGAVKSLLHGSGPPAAA